jgi:ribosome maturation protein SDO1
MSIAVDKAVVGRLVVAGQKFEILVDPNKALDFKKGVKIAVQDVLAYPVIYKDAKTTTEAVATADLQKAFGTTDPLKAAEKIIRDGEIQLTTEQRRSMVDQKKTQIAAIIAKKGVNPQTNAPHPQQRIMGVMDQVGVMIDPFADAESQVDKVLKAIKVVIPIKFEKLVLQVKVPPQHAGKVFPVLKSGGSLKSEQWLNDGSLQAEVEILAGVQDEFMQKIANATHGEYESKVLKREDAA